MAERRIKNTLTERQKKLNLPDRQKKVTAARKTAKQKNTVTDNKLELLITTVARNKADYFADLIQSFDVNLQMTVFAEGTADSGMLAALGINDSAKAVIFSVIQEKKLPDAMSSLENKFKTIKGGKGIAFTVPLSSVIGTLIFGFLSNNTAVVEDNNGKR